MQSDTNSFDHPPRAVAHRTCPERGHLVVTFLYADGTEHTVHCDTPEGITQAQIMAQRIGVIL